MAAFPLPANLHSEEALVEIHDSVWTLLQTAASGTSAGWRLPVLGTRNGQRCEQRTVVLRMVDRSRAAFLFHTDLRSPKVEQIRDHSEVSLLFYDRDLAAQLKVSGNAAVLVSDQVVDALWEAASPASLKMYSASVPPGSTSPNATSNLPTHLCNRLPERAEIEAGRENFCVIRIEAHSIEWLRLSQGGNLRTEFGYVAGEFMGASWLAP